MLSAPPADALGTIVVTRGSDAEPADADDRPAGVPVTGALAFPPRMAGGGVDAADGAAAAGGVASARRD